jgi:hypothetical protein
MQRRLAFAAGSLLWLAAVALLAPPLPETDGAAAAAAAPPARQSGVPARARFRVSLVRFAVNRETWDDALERDGKRDEVYVVAHALVYGVDGRLLSDWGPRRSRVLGDPTGRPERIPAGSTPANPGLFGIGASDAGGLRTGDSFPADFAIPPAGLRMDAPPMLLWEGELVGRSSPRSSETNVALVVLTIWEWDSPGHDAEPVAPPVVVGNDVNYFLTRTLGGELPPDAAFDLPKSLCPCGDCDAKKPCPTPEPPHPSPEPPPPPPVDFAALNVLDRDPWTVTLLRGGAGSDVRVADTFSGDPRNRPIGMTDAGGHYEFKPLALVLPYAVASYGGGAIVDLHYRDDERLKGDYKLTVLIERLP